MRPNCRTIGEVFEALDQKIRLRVDTTDAELRRDLVVAAREALTEMRGLASRHTGRALDIAHGTRAFQLRQTSIS